MESIEFWLSAETVAKERHDCSRVMEGGKLRDRNGGKEYRLVQVIPYSPSFTANTPCLSSRCRFQIDFRLSNNHYFHNIHWLLLWIPSDQKHRNSIKIYNNSEERNVTSSLIAGSVVSNTVRHQEKFFLSNMISMLIHANSKLLLLFFLVTTFHILPPPIADAKFMVNTLTSLYNNSDGVMNLDHSNFASSVFGKGNAFLIKFYAIWCGHCITFASRYKKLAADVIAWRSVVRLAAVNCADTVNLNLCRDQSVTSYPTLKYYEPFSETNAQGREFFLVEQTTNSMRKSLLHSITEYIRSIDPRERDSKLSSWPQLMPFNVSSQPQVIQRLELPYEAKPVLMVIEGPPATSADVAIEVMLDLSSYLDSVIIRRMLYHSSNLRKVFASKFSKGLLIPDPESDISQYPLLVQLKSGTHKKLLVQLLQSSSEEKDADTMRKEFVQFVASNILKDKWINPAALLTSYANNKPEHEDSSSSMASSGIVSNSTTDSNLIGDKVHMADMNNAIRYSLYQETLLHQRLNSTKMTAIHQYLVVLFRYFPFENDNQKRWVKRMSVWVKARNETTAASLHSAMKAGAEGLIFPNRAYVSCRGSRPDLRGYPCGLWLLFHTLTVQEYNAMQKNASLSPMVLFAMRDYVRFFFTCKHCSQEFHAAAGDLDKRLTDVTSSVLWLWQAHNNVNQRLAKTETEDPAHPKIIYPSHELCPSCRTPSGKLNSSEILGFLSRKYERRYLVRRLPSHSCRTTQQITWLFLSCLLLILSYPFLLTD